MTFTPKTWINEINPLGPPATPPGTPLNAAALVDLETRLSDYTDTRTAFPNVKIDYGAAGDGTTDDTTAFTDAATDLAGTGDTLYVPPGTYKITAGFTVDAFRLLGAGQFKFGDPAAVGSTFALEDALESTANPVITVTGAGTVEGFSFYYPLESPTNTTPAVTATGYVVQLSAPSGGRCLNNYFYYTPYAIKNTQGFSEVSHNKICATKVGIEDNQGAGEHEFSHNSITSAYGNSAAFATYPSMNKYIAENAIAFKLTNTLATFTDNTVYGYFRGYQFLGYGQFTSILGGLVDTTFFAVQMADGCGPLDVVFEGVTFSAGDAARHGGSRNDRQCNPGRVVSIQTPGSRVNAHFEGCMALLSSGELIRVANVGGGAVNLSVNGGSWNGPGLFAHTHLMTVSGVTGTFTPSTLDNNGDVITGGTSGATAVVRQLVAGELYLDLVVGVFTVGETITGAPSGATATVGAGGARAVLPHYVARFSDNQGGDFSFQNVRCDISSWKWSAGVWVENAGMVTFTGNTLESNLSTSSFSFKVDSALRVVEGGNASNIPAGNNDLVLSGVTNHPVLGDSSWSRAAVPTVVAATTLTLPQTTKEFCEVTGNTGITSITATRVDHRVTLKFTGTPTVTDGSNLKLAGNFVAAGTTNDPDTLTLVCDGTNWYEIARSVN